jgi:hypothetical protein
MVLNQTLEQGKIVLGLTSKERTLDQLNQLLADNSIFFTPFVTAGLDPEMLFGIRHDELDSDDPREVVADKLLRLESFIKSLLGENEDKSSLEVIHNETSFLTMLESLISSETLKNDRKHIEAIIAVFQKEPALAISSLIAIKEHITNILRRTVAFTSDVVFKKDEDNNWVVIHREYREDQLKEKGSSSVRRLEEYYSPGQRVQWQVAFGTTQFVDGEDAISTFNQVTLPVFTISAQLPVFEDDGNGEKFAAAINDKTYYQPKANAKFKLLEFIADNGGDFNCEVGSYQFFITAEEAKRIVVDKLPPKDVLKLLFTEAVQETKQLVARSVIESGFGIFV